MGFETRLAEELTSIRERLEELWDEAPTPALAALLRAMSELALDAEGYAEPSTAKALPPRYVDARER